MFSFTPFIIVRFGPCPKFIDYTTSNKFCQVLFCTNNNYFFPETLCILTRRKFLTFGACCSTMVLARFKKLQFGYNYYNFIFYTFWREKWYARLSCQFFKNLCAICTRCRILTNLLYFFCAFCIHLFYRKLLTELKS